MESLFSPEYRWLWALVLGLALFLPVRQLIWVLSVRREASKAGAVPDEERRNALKRRAAVTSALLCFIVAVLYVNAVVGKLHGPQ